MNTSRWTVAFLAVLFLASGSVAQLTLPFTDTFSNNILTDSDDVEGFWTNPHATMGGTTGRNLLEENGSLTMFAGSNVTSSVSVSLRNTQEDDYLRLFEEPITISLSGLSFAFTEGASEGNGFFRFSLSDMRTTDPYSSSNAVGWEIRGNGVISLGYKVDNIAANPYQSAATFLALDEFDLGFTPTGYEMTLTPNGNDMDYQWTLFAPDPEDTTLISDTLTGLNATAWTAENDHVWMDLQTRLYKHATHPADRHVAVSISELSIIPEPGSFLLLALGSAGLRLLRSRRRAA